MGVWVIVAFASGFVIAQLAKFVFGLRSSEREKWMTSFREAMRYLVRSGGMPSGHATSFGAATTYIGLAEGFDSMLFALALCVMLVVIYDAVNVRYATGEQGKKINKIIAQQKIEEKKVRIVEGHTKIEVLFGTILGILIGVAVFFISRA